MRLSSTRLLAVGSPCKVGAAPQPAVAPARLTLCAAAVEPHCGSCVLQAMHPCVVALCAALKLAPTPGHRGAFHYIGGAARPAAAVSLRTIDPDHFAIVNEANGEALEHIEACQAFFQVGTRSPDAVPCAWLVYHVP